MLFERRMEKNVSVIDYNPSVIKINNVSKDEIAVKCLPNMSFFAARDQVNVALPEIDVAKNWLRSNMMPVVLPDTKLFPYAEHYIKENPKIKKYLLDFLKKADFNITGIESKEKVQPLSDDFIKFLLSDPYVSKEEKDRLRKEKNFPSIKTDFKHSVLSNGHIQEYWLPQKQQSKGTQRVFGLETVIYEVLNKQGFLAVDEIEKSLHPEIVEFILQRFLSEKDNRSQLLITTHYDPLLNLTNDLFRKDSVWFTEKNETGTTDLFSLVDFKGLNRISSLQKAYRSGKFGALPNVKN
jgi:AAA15 family ATPase/GTPase